MYVCMCVCACARATFEVRDDLKLSCMCVQTRERPKYVGRECVSECVYVCMYVCVCVYACVMRDARRSEAMGWLRLVGSLKV